MLIADDVMRRLARNVGWLLGGRATNAVLGLLVLAVAARALGVDGLGRLVMLHGFIQIVAEIAKFQSWQGVVRFGAMDRDSPEDMGRLIGFSGLLDGASALVAVAFLVLVGPTLTRALDWPAEIIELVPLYGTVVAFLVPGTAIGLLRLHDRFDLLAVQAATANSVRLTGAIAAWSADGGLAAFALAWWLGAAAAGLMPILRAWRLLPERKMLWPSGIRQRHRGILRFFVLTSANSIIALAPTHLATLIVGTLLGPAAAGLFRVARQFADSAAKPAEYLSQALYPEAARMSATRDQVRLRKVLGQSAVAALGFAILAVALLAGFGEIVLTVVVGDEFGAAYPVMAVLAFAAGLSVAASPVEPTLIAMGETGAVILIKAACAALHVALMLVFAKVMGLVGIGAAAVVASGLAFISLWTYVRKVL